jgi:hypothetical protein
MNAYSIVHNYGEPTYSPDFNLISTALNFKQQKLDVNRQKLQSIYDQFSSLDVYREDHKEYVNSRLKQVLDINKSYHNMDLSDSNFASVVAGNVMQVADDVVKGAIADTRIIRKEDAEWEKHRVAADGKYNERNHQYALEMSDRQAYRGAEELGRRYKGGADFIAYTDYNKKYLDNIDKIEKRLKEKFIQEGQAAGQFRTIEEWEVIAPEKIRSEMERLFDENDKRQMNIDGWATYSKSPDEVFQREWNGKVDSQISLFETDIKKTEALLVKGGLTESERIAAQDRVKLLDKTKQTLQEQRFENLLEKGVPKESLYGKLFADNYIDGVVQTYAKANLVGKKVDEAWAEHVKFTQKQLEFQYEQNKDKEDRQYDAAKDGMWKNPQTGKWEKDPLIEAKKNAPTVVGDMPSQDGYEPNAGITSIFKERYNAIQGIDNVLLETGSFASNLTPKQRQELIQVFNNLDGKTFTPDAEGNVTVNFAGKKVKLTPDQVSRINENIAVATKESVHLKQYYQNIKGVIDTTIDEDLGPRFTRGQLTQENLLGSFDFKIVTNKQGDFQMVPTGPNEKDLYKRLVRKKDLSNNDPTKPKLTAEEQKTLEAYTAYSIMLDPNIANQDRAGLRSYLRDELLVDVKGVDGRLLPKQTTYKSIPTEKISYSGVSDKVLKEYERFTTPVKEATQSLFLLTPEDKAGFDQRNQTSAKKEPVFIKGTQGEVIANNIKTLMSKADRTNSATERTNIYREIQNLTKQLDVINGQYTQQNKPTTTGLTSIGRFDSYVDNRSGGTINLGNLESKLNRQLSASRLPLNDALENNNKQLRTEVISLPADSPQKDILLTFLQSESGWKNDYAKAPVYFTKGPGDSYYIGQSIAGKDAVKVKGKDGEETEDFPVKLTSVVLVSKDKLVQAGFKLDESVAGYKPQLLAANGDAASVVPLGNTKVEQRSFFEKNFSDVFISQKDIDMVTKNASERVKTEIQGTYDRFVNGDVVMQLAPFPDNNYYAVLVDKQNNNTVLSYHQIGEGLTGEIISNYQINKIFYQEQLFKDYINGTK